MFTCYLTSDADLGWALERVAEGHDVRVTVPKPLGTAEYRRRQVSSTNRLVMRAHANAHVSEIEYQIHGRWRRVEHSIERFLLSPQSPDDPTGVREPRRPINPSPKIAASLPR